MENLISEACDLIHPFNPDLAKAFQEQPFNRVNLALAFARGFKEDLNQTASLVLQVAYLDRTSRELDNRA